MSQTPDVVARQSLKALGKKTTVRPGWLAKLLIGSLSMLPRGTRTRIMTQIMAGMTANDPQR
jgi:short-subunit dehydrogenase